MKKRGKGRRLGRKSLGLQGRSKKFKARLMLRLRIKPAQCRSLALCSHGQLWSPCCAQSLAGNPGDQAFPEDNGVSPGVDAFPKASCLLKRSLSGPPPWPPHLHSNL